MLTLTDILLALSVGTYSFLMTLSEQRASVAIAVVFSLISSSMGMIIMRMIMLVHSLLIPHLTSAVDALRMRLWRITTTIRIMWVLLGQRVRPTREQRISTSSSVSGDVLSLLSSEVIGKTSKQPTPPPVISASANQKYENCLPSVTMLSSPTSLQEERVSLSQSPVVGMAKNTMRSGGPSETDFTANFQQDDTSPLMWYDGYGCASQSCSRRLRNGELGEKCRSPTTLSYSADYLILKDRAGEMSTGPRLLLCRSNEK